jgi:hypothetical protein
MCVCCVCVALLCVSLALKSDEFQRFNHMGWQVAYDMVTIGSLALSTHDRVQLIVWEQMADRLRPRLRDFRAPFQAPEGGAYWRLVRRDERRSRSEGPKQFN